MANYIFKNLINSKHYFTYLVNNNNNKKLFIDILNDILENKLNKLKICFDFEFNFRQIGLCQVLISSKKDNNIFLFHPTYFNNNELELIKKSLYLSNYPKILHGSESLDIPYIYNQVLNNNNKDILTFTKNIYDTRFMCENLTKMYNNPYIKCSLYDALLKSNIINEQQYQNLNDIVKEHPKIYKLHWNIYNMPEFAYKYAAYDVIFLRSFIKKLLKEKSNKLIAEYTRFVFLERNNITSISNKCISIINKNNLNKNNILDNKYDKIKDNLIGHNNDYFKKYLAIITKYILSKNKDYDILSELNNFKLIKKELQKLI